MTLGDRLETTDRKIKLHRPWRKTSPGFGMTGYEKFGECHSTNCHLIPRRKRIVTRRMSSNVKRALKGLAGKYWSFNRGTTMLVPCSRLTAKTASILKWEFESTGREKRECEAASRSDTWCTEGPRGFLDAASALDRQKFRPGGLVGVLPEH